MSNVNDIYVPSVGPLSANILLVGEAPGGDEEAEGEPFVGKSGQFLERYLNRIGIRRQEIRLSNVCHYRPKGNKFEFLLGTSALQQGLIELDAEIRAMPNLNLIVCVGNWPMYYLTGCTASKGKPGTGIMSWRGSLVPGSGECGVPSAAGRKVLVTFHPAFIIRPQGFGYHPVFFNDLKRIRQEKDSPILNYPQYDEFIDPDNLHEIAHEMSQSPILTVDIETFGSSLACVGVTDSRKRGLCVTFENPHGWDVVRELLASKQPKNMQYGVFDVNYLWWHYGWEVNGYPEGGFDTYIAAANLMPEFPRGLDFLNSMYTQIPYYKEDRKVHKQTGELSTLWHYNIKDLISQHWIMEDQIPELEELYGRNLRFP